MSFTNLASGLEIWPYLKNELMVLTNFLHANLQVYAN